MSELVEQLKAFFESDEGKEYIKRDQEKILFRNQLMDKYMLYLFNLSLEERTELFNKIKTKYDSDEYYFRWIKRGFEPQEMLYDYIFEYGYRYGKLNEIKDAAFGYDSYIIDNSWIITAWYGQGTAYNFHKIDL